MLKRYYILIIILLLATNSFTQQLKLSPKAEISVITCAPGEELYASFGHSAFRVYDPLNGIDKAYNYGIFDFNKPNFYLNFAKGKLIYELGTADFNRFLRIYHYEGREVTAQVLNLSNADVQKIYDFLEENAKPENKSYKYDFFYDNCATKLHEVVLNNLNEKVKFDLSFIKTNKTHRDLIKDYAGKNKWGQFGIDLALGSVIDVKAKKIDYLFLPDYVLNAFDYASIKQNDGATIPLVKNKKLILKQQNKKENNNLFSPYVVFGLLLIIVAYFTNRDNKTQKRTKWLDFWLFFITGIIGIAVLLLWFATDHTATYKNLNFLWAFAPNTIIAFYLLKNKIPIWVTNYTKILLLLLAALLVIWVIKIQIFNLAIIPIILLLIIRYGYIVKLSSSKE